MSPTHAAYLRGYRGRLVAVVALALTACAPSRPTVAPRAPRPNQDEGVPPAAGAKASSTTPSAPPRSATCGTPGLTLGDYDWIPADARGAIALAIASVETSAALTALAEHGRAADHGLPITLAFAVTQWPIVVPVLGSLLDSVGLQPDEIVYVTPASGPAFAWVVRSDCDLDEAVARVGEQWGLVARRRVEGIVAESPPDPNRGDGTLTAPPKAGRATDPSAAASTSSADAAAFPYDVVFASGGRVALVPRGYGAAFLTMLHAHGSRRSSAWSQRFDAMDPAPVRGILSGGSLVGSRTQHTSAATTLRAFADGVSVEPLREATASDTER